MFALAKEDAGHPAPMTAMPMQGCTIVIHRLGVFTLALAAWALVSFFTALRWFRWD